MFRPKVPHLDKRGRERATKQFMLLFLSLLQICGLITLAISTWIVIKFTVTKCSLFYTTDQNLLLASGAICVILCWCGYCIVLKLKNDQDFEMRPFICTFIVVLALQISAGISATMQDSKENEFRQTLQEMFSSNDSSQMQCAMNLQQKFQCCGNTNYSDWFDHDESKAMLRSCDCDGDDDNDENGECHKFQRESVVFNVYTKPCSDQIIESVGIKLRIIRILSTVFPVLELMLLTFVSCLIYRFTHKSSVRNTKNIYSVSNVSYIKKNPNLHAQTYI